LEAVVTAATA
jgi:hypothetical protein